MGFPWSSGGIESAHFSIGTAQIGGLFHFLDWHADNKRRPNVSRALASRRAVLNGHGIDLAERMPSRHLGIWPTAFGVIAEQQISGADIRPETTRLARRENGR